MSHSYSPPYTSSFYPRPPRGGRPQAEERLGAALGVSIHVLREEDDDPQPRVSPASSCFYPRPPRGGRLAGCQHTALVSPAGFYPRPPRGGRLGVFAAIVGHCEVSIHVLREEDDRVEYRGSGWNCHVSIHVLREEDDYINTALDSGCFIVSIHVLREEDDNLQNLFVACYVFLSTSSARRTTEDRLRRHYHHRVSIHVLREEDDTPKA